MGNKPTGARIPDSWRFARKTYLPNTSYHVTSRRPRRLALFRDARDCKAFEAILRRLLAAEPSFDRWGNLVEPAGGIRVTAYCLMESHFHLIVHQDDDPRAISMFMQRLQHTYSLHFRRRHGHTGKLYEGRYRAVTIEDPSHLARAIAYTHANPIEQAFEWEWSSHSLFMGTKADGAAHWCDAQAGLDAFQNRGHYLERLHAAIEEKRRERDAKRRR